MVAKSWAGGAFANRYGRILLLCIMYIFLFKHTHKIMVFARAKALKQSIAVRTNLLLNCH